MRLDKIKTPIIGEAVPRYSVIEEQTMKAYIDGKDVKVQRKGRIVTEAQVDAELAKWQEIKDKIVETKV